MIRVTSLDEVTPGDVFWAYARGRWRLVRVVAKARTRVTVAYTVDAGRGTRRLVGQVLQLNKLRWDRPAKGLGVIDAPAPERRA